MGRTEGSHSNNNEIRHQFRLRVRTELEQLIPVLKWFENHTQSLLPETIIWQVKVALAEGFTNTVRYAHQHLPHETPIELALAIFSNYLELKIWDYGNPFDLHKNFRN